MRALETARACESNSSGWALDVIIVDVINATESSAAVPTVTAARPGEGMFGDGAEAEFLSRTARCSPRLSQRFAPAAVARAGSTDYIAENKETVEGARRQ